MSKRRKLMMDSATREKDLHGKIYIVTGANSGIGLETTRHLIKQGGHVIMACRRVEAAQAQANTFKKLQGSYAIMKLDLASLESVRAFVNKFLESYQHLDGLVCNAGTGFFDRKATYTVDGLEMTMAVNFYGHFLMTELLLDLLKKTPSSRIILLSSAAHAGSPKSRPKINLEDMNYKTRPYKSISAYSEAKVASILYAKELAHRLSGTSVTAYSVHPGWARSNFARNNILMKIMAPIMNIVISSSTDSNEESAQTSLHCLLSQDAPKHNGAYFSQSSVLYRDKECVQGGWPMRTPNPHADSLDTAKQLVHTTNLLVNLGS